WTDSPRLPSGEKARQVGGTLYPCNWRTSVKVSTSQNRMIGAVSPNVRARLPSGDNAMQTIDALCWANVPFSSMTGAGGGVSLPVGGLTGALGWLPGPGRWAVAWTFWVSGPFWMSVTFWVSTRSRDDGVSTRAIAGILHITAHSTSSTRPATAMAPRPSH